MFRSTVSDTTEPTRDESSPLEPLISLVELELSLDAPVEGWTVFLAARGIEVTLDDIGRMAVARVDARRLLTEKREREAEQARRRKLAEAQAVADDQLRRSRIWGGAPAVEGVSAAALMLQADKDAQPRRRSVLQEALSNSDGMTFHSLAPTPDGSES
jgi:hypothetical protein